NMKTIFLPIEKRYSIYMKKLSYRFDINIPVRDRDDNNIYKSCWASQIMCGDCIDMRNADTAYRMIDCKEAYYFSHNSS
ncbi:MAG TPA: hypothetical protein VFJ51_13015, partial [Nitrososphaeraceae archaeon]|nr:hypothetical protein [Nitrososphaeraceae archaeon]